MNELLQHLDDSYHHSSSNGSTNGHSQEDRASADLQGALSRVTHDINNPLSIISGNAQLLLELSRALDLDPDVAKPIRDIEEASQRLASMVQRLNALNEATHQRENGKGGA
jgi:nitrogen-specific signal transduction histidine kinase